MMEVDCFFGGNALLVVGDGDFSFSVALSRYPQFQTHNVTSSSLETELSIEIHAQAVENIATLQSLGVSVCLEVDARELHTHKVISKHKYDRIIFNFPLADRHNIKKNRALLGDFFISCCHVLSANGHVIVTLCKGQGGTPADKPMRSWHDSWQIAAMATNAGFVLKSVIPFDASLFPEYHSVGFRFQDKSFNTSGALIHIFELAELIQDTDSGIWGTVTYNDHTYSCNHYVASKMKRTLLTEPCNPAALLKSRLESSLNDVLKSCVYFQSPAVLSGPRSFAYIVKNKVDGYTMSDYAKSSERNAKVDMEVLKQEPLNNFKMQTLLHGIENCDGEKYCEHDSHTHLFLPLYNDAVYVLVRLPTQAVKFNTDNEGAQGKVRKASVTDKTIEEASYHPCVNASNDLNFGPDQSSPVFHHRVSLLENLPEICNKLMTSSPCFVNREGKHMEAISESHIDCGHEQLLYEENPSPQYINSLPCLITSGQCMLPGPICKNFTPVQQELMAVHQISHLKHFKGLPKEPSTLSSTSGNSSDSIILNNVSTNIVSAFNRSKVLSSGFTFSLQACDSVKLFLQGADHCLITNRILLQSKSSDDLDSKEASVIGHIIYACIEGHDFHITLINITNFTCQIWGIEDKRLLWCTHKEFLSQFHFDTFSSPRIMKPPSLYPLKFVHDISFWEKVDDTVFDNSSFCSIIRSIAEDHVTHVSLIDTYFDPVTRRKSQCYRLHFQSSYQALPYQTSWKLQSWIRMEVAKKLGVILR